MNPAQAASGQNTLDRAEVLIRLGRHEAAQAELAALLGAEPDNSVAHAYLSYALLGAGHAAEAGASARAAVRLQPDNLVAWQAIVQSEQALWRACDPGFVDIRLEHHETALAAADRCVALHPLSPDGHRLRAQVLTHYDPAAALLAIGTALELDPTDPDLHVVRGRALWRDDDALSPEGVAAGTAFAEALRLDPMHAQALYYLGCHDAAREDWEAARARLRRSAELEPTYGPAVREMLERIAASSGSVTADRLSWRAEYLDPPKSDARVWAVATVVAVLILIVAVAVSKPPPPDSPPGHRSPRTSVPADLRYPVVPTFVLPTWHSDKPPFRLPSDFPTLRRPPPTAR
ncbi:tetratricopeptide repeat protein [Nocardia sp. NPDC056064]|uniref:tetratricopeptide repeat protein n=1 Tax=Nocardia sp. NPDC056064 TaxID=3345701 RepID=UPI0035D9DC34